MTKKAQAATFRKLLKNRGFIVPETMTDLELVALERAAYEAHDAAEELDLAQPAWDAVIAAGVVSWWV